MFERHVAQKSWKGIYFLLFWSIQVFGLMTQPLIRFLLPHSKTTTSLVTSDSSTPKSFAVPLLESMHNSDADGHNFPRPSSLRMLLATPYHSVHHYWRKFDDAIMRPMFGGRGFVPFVPGSPTERSAPQYQ